MIETERKYNVTVCGECDEPNSTEYLSRILEVLGIKSKIFGRDSKNYYFFDPVTKVGVRIERTDSGLFVVRKKPIKRKYGVQVSNESEKRIDGDLEKVIQLNLEKGFVYHGTLNKKRASCVCQGYKIDFDILKGRWGIARQIELEYDSRAKSVAEECGQRLVDKCREIKIGKWALKGIYPTEIAKWEIATLLS